MLGLGNTLSGGIVPAAATGFTNSYSLDFDGVDDFINLGNTGASSQPLQPVVANGVTASVWCKWADITTATARIFSNSSVADKYYGLSFSKNASGLLSMNTGDGEGGGSADRRTIRTNATPFSNDTWHHIVVVWTDEAVSNWKIYVDGSDIASTSSGTGNENAYVTSADVFIGKRVTGSTSYFNGKMDELGLWSTALDADAVTVLYNSGVPIDLTSDDGNYDNSSDLVGYWRMGEDATFPTIPDASTNTADGTMTNMTSGDIQTDVPS